MTLSLFADDLPRGSAAISDCGLYRYALVREWSPGARVAFCMLNPSKADAKITDPTLSRGVAFAKRWGFGSLEFVNLFAFRSTDKRVLSKVADPIGPDNDAHILAAAGRASLFIVAWGVDGGLRNRDRQVLELLRCVDRCVPHALRVTKGGFAEHPLYLPGELKPKPYLGRPETT